MDASRPQSDTLVRGQSSSCGERRTVARGGTCKQWNREKKGTGGRKEQFVLSVKEYKSCLKQCAQQKHFEREKKASAAKNHRVEIVFLLEECPFYLKSS